MSKDDVDGPGGLTSLTAAYESTRSREQVGSGCDELLLAIRRSGMRDFNARILTTHPVADVVMRHLEGIAEPADYPSTAGPGYLTFRVPMEFVRNAITALEHLRG